MQTTLTHIVSGPKRRQVLCPEICSLQIQVTKIKGVDSETWFANNLSPVVIHLRIFHSYARGIGMKAIKKKIQSIADIF